MKCIPDLWIAVLKTRDFSKIFRIFSTVIHRQNDGRKTAANWRKYAVSAIMDSLKKGVPVMAVRYTEEQLNTIDKSLLIQMFLNQQEQLETLTTEARLKCYNKVVTGVANKI